MRGLREPAGAGRPGPRILVHAAVHSAAGPGGPPGARRGLTDNVPVAAVERADRPTLVLLARRYARLPPHAGRRYGQPSAPVPVAAWDYTDARGIQAAFDLGRRDGERFGRDPVMLPCIGA